MQVGLELISDYICPWCYVAKIRLEKIKDLLEGEIAVEIDIKPYILYPHIPPGGAPKEDFAKNTKPGMGRSLKYEAAQENIEINYRKITRIPYSLEAHRLAWLVEDKNLRYALSKKIFHDYFQHGINIGEEEYLVQAAGSVGVSKLTIGKFLDPQQGYQEVRQAIDSVRTSGIATVPCIRFSEHIVLPSLQPRDVWINYIRRTAKMQST